MSRRSRMAFLLLILGGLLLAAALPGSMALNQIMLQRSAAVRLAEDRTAVLGLTGFNNKTYDMGGTYKSFGTVTNNSGCTIILTVTVIPDFQLYHLFSGFGLAIGGKTCEFSYYTSSPKQITLTLASGQTVEAKAYFTNNLFYLLAVDFKFSAVDTAGTFTIKLTNTQSTPRHINLY